MFDIRLKRAYEPADPTDGYRVLVDRLWPRGLSKQAARLDGWAKELTPSTDLRRAYHSGELPFDQFAAAYRRELDRRDEARDSARQLADTLKQQPVTLVYATSNTEQNHAQTLLAWLRNRMGAID